MDMKKLKIIAQKMPSTSKPDLIILSARIIINASKIMRNNPKVMMVTGIVKISSIGLTNIFKRAKTMEMPIAVPKLETTTCGSKI